MSNIKTIIKNNRQLKLLTSYLYRACGRNTIRCHGSNNRIVTNIPGLFLLKSKIQICGNNNVIEFAEGDGVTNFSHLSISIHGNNNLIRIGANSSGNHLSLNMEDDNNQILLGEHFDCGSNTELAAIEGTTISFGNDCMLSANITVRTGDSHSVTDLTGKRINPSKSIVFGDHVWIGNTVLIFKASQIGAHSVIAGGSVVTGKVFPDHCIIGGNPAKVIKEGVDWKRERIKV